MTSTRLTVADDVATTAPRIMHLGRIRPRLHSFALAQMSLAGLTFLVITGLAVARVGMDFGHGLGAGLILLGGLAWTANRVRSRHEPTRLIAMVQGFAIMALLTIMGELASAVLAIGNAPFIDQDLLALDRLLFPGLDWLSILNSVYAHPLLMIVLSYAYVSLNWQPFVYLLLSLRWGSIRALENFAGAWGATLLGCVAFFHWLPARGPFALFGVDGTSLAGAKVTLAWDFLDKLETLRSPALKAVDITMFSGLVTYPSFHAAGAVLLSWAFWPMRVLRWPMLALNATMLLAAVPIGGHYFVDLPAGAAVALLAIVATRRFGGAAASLPSVS